MNKRLLFLAAVIILILLLNLDSILGRGLFENNAYGSDGEYGEGDILSGIVPGGPVAGLLVNRQDKEDEEEPVRSVQEQLQRNSLVSLLGAHPGEIENIYGAPDDSGNYKGSNYYAYHDASIQTGFLYPLSVQCPSGKVHGIIHYGEKEFLGVKTGMTFDEIKSILGAPDEEWHSEIYDEYVLTYQFKDVIDIDYTEEQSYNSLNLAFAAEKSGAPIYLIQLTAFH